MTFQIYSPDGFPIERDKEYNTLGEVQEAIERFVNRFRAQGYYSNSNRERIPIDEIEENCKIINLNK